MGLTLERTFTVFSEKPVCNRARKYTGGLGIWQDVILGWVEAGERRVDGMDATGATDSDPRPTVDRGPARSIDYYAGPPQLGELVCTQTVIRPRLRTVGVLASARNSTV